MVLPHAVAPLTVWQASPASAHLGQQVGRAAEQEPRMERWGGPSPCPATMLIINSNNDNSKHLLGA